RVPSLSWWLCINKAITTLTALVPKFHLQSHVEACHSAFSFNFFKGVGRTDGEGVEQNWEDLNGQGPSTSKLLPGSQWDTLDDCAGWVNWRKTVGLGNLLLKRILLATPMAKGTHRNFDHLDKCLRKEDPTEHAAMQTALTDWEDDHKNGDPYRMPKSTVTLHKIRLLLAEEDKARAEIGNTSVNEVSAAAFICLGMDIQHLQELLRRDMKGTSTQTILQNTTITEHNTIIIKHINRFCNIQRTYMPAFDSTASSYAVTASDKPEHWVLYMPSDLMEAQH
ncbi:hypothetical protein HWV62_13513, partial [Athelia sp. TMB]